MYFAIVNKENVMLTKDNIPLVWPEQLGVMLAVRSYDENAPQGAPHSFVQYGPTPEGAMLFEEAIKGESEPVARVWVPPVLPKS